MKKFFKVLINTVLVLVLVCALGWYFVGDEMFGKAIADAVASDNETIRRRTVRTAWRATAGAVRS